MSTVSFNQFPGLNFFQHLSGCACCGRKETLTVGPRCPRGPGFPDIPYRKIEINTKDRYRQLALVTAFVLVYIQCIGL